MSGPEKRNYGVSVERASGTRPMVAPGTACAPCTAKGHFCAAYEMVDGRAVCLHCLDGVPCMRPARNGAFRSISGPPKPAPEPPTTPQPALAAGAEPSAAMPARRHFGGKTVAQRPWHSKMMARERAERMLEGGSSVLEAARATGLSKSTVARVRGEMIPAAKNAAEGLSIAEAQDIAKRVVRADKVTMRVAAIVAAATDSTKVTSDLYQVVSRAAIPGRVTSTAHDDTMRLLRELPEDEALARTFSDAGAARRFGDTVQKAARKRGVKVSFRCAGAVLYLWLDLGRKA